MTFKGSVKLNKGNRLIYETNDKIMLIIFCGKHDQYEHYYKEVDKGRFKQHFN